MSQETQIVHACRDVALRYCRGVDRLDPDVMRSAYWPDAIDDHGTFVGNAYEFVEHCMVSHLRWRSTMHCVMNHLVEVDSATEARGEIYNVSYLFRADEPIVDTWWGRYLDRYECRNGEWRIIHRVCVNEATMSAEIGSPMAIDVSRFRGGDVDRPNEGRPLGPG